MKSTAAAGASSASPGATDSSSRRLEVEEVGRARAAAGEGGAEVAGERVREAGEGVREAVAARPGAIRRRQLGWREETGAWLGRELPPRGRGGELRDSCLMHRAAGSDDVREVSGLVVLVALHPLQEVVTHG